MYELARSLPLRALALVLATGVAGLGCPRPNLQPASGVPEYQLSGMIRVPGGTVNAAGGNLMIERLDMSIDTVMGTQEIRAVYNASSGEWLWSFQVTYDGAAFLDPTGATHDVGAIADGGAIPGTVYVKADADTIETKGGLAFHFDASGALSHVSWKTAGYPRLQYTRTPGLLEIEQCPAAPSCLPFYSISLDPAGDPLSVTDARTGRVADFQYDGLGRLVVARDALDVDEGWPGFRYEYSEGGTLLTAITNSEGERIEYLYQGNRRILDVIQIGEGNPTHHFGYTGKDSAGLYKTHHTNPLGALTRYVVDGDRRLHRVERVDAGEVLTITWEGRRPATMRLPNGATSSFVYVNDLLATLTQPSGNVVTFLYEPGGLNREDPLAAAVARIEDSLGAIEERSYDALGRVETMANGEGETAVFTYHPGWAIASVTDPSGVTNTFPRYGVHGHWLDMEGSVSDHRAFDAVGNVWVASVVRERGGFLLQTHDGDRNLAALELAATDTEGHVTATDTVAIARRSDGQISFIARPGGGDQETSYDLLGRPVVQREWVDGQWQARTLEYDLAGHLTARTRPNGMREEFDYDGYGRLTARRALRDDILEGEAVLSYADGGLVSLFDSLRGTTETYSYDSAGRLVQTLYGFGETLTREYDARSRLTRERFEVPGAGVVADLGYEYDLADRRIRITDRLAQEVLEEHSFQDGLLASTWTGNGLTRTRSYDPTSGDLLGFTTTDPLDVVVETTELEYTAELDPPRRQIRTVATTPLAVTEEQYWLGLPGSLGNPDQRVGKRVFGWNRGGAYAEAFAYDELGNRISDPSGNTFTYNAERNRLLSASLAGSGQTLTYTYDEAGFATSRGGVPITWTAAGRIASHGEDVFAWDMEGRLVSLSVAGIEVPWLWFGGRVQGDPGAATLGALDLGTVSIQLVTGERLYRHLDFRANVRFTSDDAGQITAHYRYRPYGLDAVFGSPGDPVSFVGRAEIGELMILGERVYDPAVGRFLSPDPVYQLTNQYTYTMGNPVWYMDPDGRDANETEASGDKVEHEVKFTVKFSLFKVLELEGTYTAKWSCGLGAGQALPIVWLWWLIRLRRRRRPSGTTSTAQIDGAWLPTYTNCGFETGRFPREMETLM